MTLADVGSEKEYPIVPEWLPMSDVIFGEIELYFKKISPRQSDRKI